TSKVRSAFPHVQEFVVAVSTRVARLPNNQLQVAVSLRFLRDVEEPWIPFGPIAVYVFDEVFVFRTIGLKASGENSGSFLELPEEFLLGKGPEISVRAHHDGTCSQHFPELRKVGLAHLECGYDLVPFGLYLMIGSEAPI